MLKMKTLDFPMEIKDLSDSGTFSGYAAVFGNVDLQFDVIERGAFEEIVKTKDGKVRILNQHNTRQPIGKASVKQDDRGLFVEGGLVLENADARNVYALMKQGILDGLSVGFDILANGSEIMESGVRKLKRLKLWEFSLVTFGANPLATVESVKEALPPKFETIREAEFWLRDELGFSHGEAKEFVSCFKAALIGTRDGSPRDEASGEGDVKEMLDFLQTIPKGA